MSIFHRIQIVSVWKMCVFVNFCSDLCIDILMDTLYSLFILKMLKFQTREVWRVQRGDNLLYLDM